MLPGRCVAAAALASIAPWGAEGLDYLVAMAHDALEASGDGWWDDNIAFAQPWGFAVEANRTPIQVWQGADDRFVPWGHGVWLAEHLGNAEPHLSREDGHLTLAGRVPEVHAWLLDRFGG